ncbi:MAG TPA: hypothetical protein PLB91_01090 [Spirochaetales bacterium]|nr:hypothetical protein [Spirochaetales bacterium]
MTAFKGPCSQKVALERLAAAGWIRRKRQVESDYEAFIRSNGDAGMLLVDFALGRFILDATGLQVNLLTHCDDAEGDPEYDAILHALYEGEVVA